MTSIADSGITRAAPPARALVVGAGTMGAGIAQSLLSVNAEVTLVDANPLALAAAGGRITEGLQRQWRDETGREQLLAAARSRLTTAAEIPSRDDLQLAIEAVPELVDLKRSVLAALDARCPDAVIASNTSSLSIRELSTVFADPSRFVGMHFFNPVPRSLLIELVVSDATSEATLTSARQWSEALGKTAIVVRDSPGFATSRLGLALGLEAIRMVEEGVASPADIDAGMTLGYKHPVGPLRLTDIVGLDVRLGIAEHLAATLGPRFDPPALLRSMVADGRLGQKTGTGFYTWP
ncbi:MAG TPA: 3-hydroxyacyl-CoA dehydrogenase family protein [Ilumatobacter sp.]|nr:3-hydroxyacyl-CoA dehydrogenase family protein [Ilumatobacter sp.]